ncbi:MAG: hypothetical protein JXR95_14205 [Deltaproteobacteria bacterium]|nr:hypothetical protein [Deltaproteobacteria bacterium]
MNSTYEYHLLIKKSGNADLEMPQPPENTSVRIYTEGKGYTISIPVGYTEDVLIEIVEWIIEIVPKISEDGKFFDPQTGYNWEADVEPSVLASEIQRHDKWLLDNMGIGSASSMDYDEPGMPARTKMLIWFAIFLFGLFLLVKVSLTMYLG